MVIYIKFCKENLRQGFPFENNRRSNRSKDTETNVKLLGWKRIKNAEIRNTTVHMWKLSQAKGYNKSLPGKTGKTTQTSKRFQS